MIISLPFFRPSVEKPKSGYLVALSTPHGIMQHTMYNLPDPDHGYATDDNARALIVAHQWKNEDKKNAPLMRNLETAYLRFLKFSQNPEGKFHCYISFDLQKRELGVGDWFGRSIFALSFLSYYSKKFGPVSRGIVFKSVPIIKRETLSLRTKSFLLFGIYYLLKANERDKFFKKTEVADIYKLLKKWRNEMLEIIKKNGSTDWYWPENIITYDNGKIIQAYLLLGIILDEARLGEIGRNLLDFYMKKTLKRGYFQAPGNHGFWERNGSRKKYDEQCIEAYSAVAANITAYKIFKDRRYLKQAKLCYQWFWGKNRLKKSLVDRRSGAVFDGLSKDSLNDNQGAESLLSLHLAYFALSKKIHV